MSLEQKITQILMLIEQAEIEYNRKPGSVLLVAVTKKQSIASIKMAFQLGLTHFGENYYQEALGKIEALKELSIDWHFIGSIQSNKTKGIATHFDWVHGLVNQQTALLLNKYRPPHLPALNVCLQINSLAEKSKSGLSPHEAQQLAVAVSQLPRLRLRGLMCIPPPPKNPEESYPAFLQLSQLMLSINLESKLQMDTLSMGMSDDFIPGIQAGATIVRLGRALFGERQ